MSPFRFVTQIPRGDGPSRLRLLELASELFAMISCRRFATLPLQRWTPNSRPLNAKSLNVAGSEKVALPRPLRNGSVASLPICPEGSPENRPALLTMFALLNSRSGKKGRSLGGFARKRRLHASTPSRTTCMWQVFGTGSITGIWRNSFTSAALVGNSVRDNPKCCA
jgi:hypothetical protein